jgi:hypothetical protein
MAYAAGAAEACDFGKNYDVNRRQWQTDCNKETIFGQNRKLPRRRPRRPFIQPVTPAVLCRRLAVWRRQLDPDGRSSADRREIWPVGSDGRSTDDDGYFTNDYDSANKRNKKKIQKYQNETLIGKFGVVVVVGIVVQLRQFLFQSSDPVSTSTCRFLFVVIRRSIWLRISFDSSSDAGDRRGFAIDGHRFRLPSK